MHPLMPIVLGLAQYAPTLIRFLGAGDASAAVLDQVVTVAREVTGGTSPDDALKRIQSEPAVAAEFQRRMLELDTQLERDHLVDRQDARKRDMAMLQAGQHNRRADWMVAFDAFGLVVCLLVLGLWRRDLPAEVVTLVSTIAGIFGLCLRDAHQFEFGSSRGSREKDSLMAQQGGSR